MGFLENLGFGGNKKEEEVTFEDTAAAGEATADEMDAKLESDIKNVENPPM